jgi:fructokinase
MKRYDVTALGEILIDELKTEDGTVANVGGAPANFARGAARMGLKSAFIGAVGDDRQGRNCILALVGDSVEPLCSVKHAATTVALVTLDASGDRDFRFVRGADALLTETDIPVSAIASSGILHIGTLSLSEEPVRGATLAALAAAKEAGVPVSCDVNYREALWPSPETARDAALSVLPEVSYLKVSGEEAELLAGAMPPEKAAEELAALGPKIVAVTLGADGAVVFSGGSTVRIAAKPVSVVDTTGAGDSFWAAFLACMIRSGAEGEISPELAQRCAEAGVEAAAECVSRQGAL